MVDGSRLLTARLLQREFGRYDQLVILSYMHYHVLLTGRSPSSDMMCKDDAVVIRKLDLHILLRENGADTSAVPHLDPGAMAVSPLKVTIGQLVRGENICGGSDISYK